MPRKFRRSKRRQTVNDAWFVWATGGTISEGEPGFEDFVEYEYFLHDEDILRMWHADGKRVLDAWIAAAPGTRPDFWWRFDAPRQIGAWNALPEPRRRLGGTGQPSWEVFPAIKPSYGQGIPSVWIDQNTVDLFKNGRPGWRNPDPDWPGVAIDPDDPPVFESQATYLDRLHLLLPGERKRLAADDFEPDIVGSYNH